LPLDRFVQCEAAVGTLDAVQRVPGNSDARTTPRARLRLGANPQRAMAARTPYATERQQHHDDGDWDRGVERPTWNPCRPLQDIRRNQAGKEEWHSYAPDNSVPLIKAFAHRFHGARFYSPWNAAQCSRQIRALHRPTNHPLLRSPAAILLIAALRGGLFDDKIKKYVKCRPPVQ
jgi:hypothetical protein